MTIESKKEVQQLQQSNVGQEERFTFEGKVR